MKKANWFKFGMGVLVGLVVLWFTVNRYQQVNANSHQTIKIVKIYQDQIIHQPAVNFSFHQVHVKRKSANYQVFARFTIKQVDPLSYGDRGVNYNFWENLRLVIPYSMLGVAQVHNLDGTAIKYQSMTNTKTHDVLLKFLIPNEQFNLRSERPYLLFMVPSKNGYIKYELEL